MDYKTYEERLKYLLETAEKGRLMSRQQMADKFSCSVETIQRMLNHLRENGHDIQFSKALKKYQLKYKSGRF